jgi:hypothetical protein
MKSRGGGGLVVRDGDYVVWFRTPGGNGTGRIRLAEGRISGGDAYITYEGWYRLDHDKYQAVINTRRHTEGPPTWFGADDVVIRVSGNFIGRTGVGTGTVDQCPGLSIGVTLMRVEDEAPHPEIDYSKVPLHPERLPRPEPER